MSHSLSLQRLFLKCKTISKDAVIEVWGRVHAVDELRCVLGDQGFTAQLKLGKPFNLKLHDMVKLRCRGRDLHWIAENALEVHEFSHLQKMNVEEGGFVTPSSQVDRYHLWNKFIGLIEDYLKAQGLVRVQTPTLVSCPGTEPHLQPFVTDFRWGKIQKKYFLPTSPELHLKKLLSAGFTDIYEIKSCFRNEELSTTHEPEFTMLEWYRAYADLQLISEDLLGLLKHLQITGFAPLSWGHVKRLSIAELFFNHLNFDLQPQTSLEELTLLARNCNLNVKGDENWEDLFNWIFVAAIEPQLPHDRPVLVHSYPPQLCAFSRINQLGWSERFELYLCGFELANAFDELTDADEYLKRMQKDLAQRRQLNREEVFLDQEFLYAMKFMPPAGGIALGLERLFMACLGLSHISQVRAFAKSGEFTL